MPSSASGAGKPGAPPDRPVNRRRRAIRRAVLAGLAAIVVTGLAIGRHLRVNRRRVLIGVPTPVKVAVLGDFHVAMGGWGETMAQEAVQEAMRRQPDLVILVGDFVSGRRGLRRLHTALAGLHAPLGVYAVQGNHEHWTDPEAVRRELEALGIRLLVNEHVVVRQGDTRLALVGLDDLWAGKADWEAAFHGVPEGVPVVLISHNPDAALDPRGQRAALLLSGHTHGGLIGPARPLLRALDRYTGRGWPPGTRYGRSHLSGLFREGGSWVYITGGVTPGFSPPRWFLRPEIGVLEVS